MPCADKFAVGNRQIHSLQSRKWAEAFDKLLKVYRAHVRGIRLRAHTQAMDRTMRIASAIAAT